MRKEELFSLYAGVDENRILGDVSRYDALRYIHKLLKPEVYLEIGVLDGKSLSIANGTAYGVDPCPLVEFSDRKIFRMTSDEFFEKETIEPPDLIFIDGMHLSEQVLKDFIGCERIGHDRTVIVVDDIYPAHPAQAERVCRTRKWTGDVWKLLYTLKRHRKDLIITSVNSSPTGMIIITNINPKSRKRMSIDATLGDYPSEDHMERVGVERVSAVAIQQAVL